MNKFRLERIGSNGLADDFVLIAEYKRGGSTLGIYLFYLEFKSPQKSGCQSKKNKDLSQVLDSQSFSSEELIGEYSINYLGHKLINSTLEGVLEVNIDSVGFFQNERGTFFEVALNSLTSSEVKVFKIQKIREDGADDHEIKFELKYQVMSQTFIPQKGFLLQKRRESQKQVAQSESHSKEGDVWFFTPFPENLLHRTNLFKNLKK